MRRNKRQLQVQYAKVSIKFYTTLVASSFADACAKFGSFLSTNAIAPYNDALKEYMQLLIKQEQSKVSQGGDVKVLQGLESSLAAYEQEVNRKSFRIQPAPYHCNNILLQVKILDKAMANKSSNVKQVQASDIYKLKQMLFDLPLKGAELRKVFEVCGAGRLFCEQNV